MATSITVVLKGNAPPHQWELRSLLARTLSDFPIPFNPCRFIGLIVLPVVGLFNDLCALLRAGLAVIPRRDHVMTLRVRALSISYRTAGVANPMRDAIREHLLLCHLGQFLIAVSRLATHTDPGRVDMGVRLTPAEGNNCRDLVANTAEETFPVVGVLRD